MIRLHYREDLPMLACVAQEGSRVVLVVNPVLQQRLSVTDKEDLFNGLMAEIEYQYGTVVNIADLRERRAITEQLRAGLTQTKKVAHGVDQISPQW